MAKSKGWSVAQVEDVPPMRDTFTPGWHSIRWFMGIEAFGVNAITRKKGEWLTKEHDELETGHQELFIILKGKAMFTIDGKKVPAKAGTMIAVNDPKIKRSADAITKTTMLIIGGEAGKKYAPQSWT